MAAWATYPDASVVCGPTERDPDKKTNVTNPRVLVEVTSDGTEEYDQGQKLEHYKQIPSLEAVVIVSHRERWIEVWSRSSTSSSWESVRSGPGERARIAAIDAALEVSAVFEASQEPR